MHNSQLATTFVLLFWCILINLKIQSHVPFDLLSTQTSAISAYEKVTDEFSETDIDFSKYQIIAVFDVVHGNGGWSIDITGISEYKPTSEITVTIENLKKGNSASVITHPYHIVKIPRTANKIRFQEIDIPLWDYQLEGVGTLCQWINLGYKNELIVINSNEELGNYISCANGQTNYGISNISKNYNSFIRENTC